MPSRSLFKRRGSSAAGDKKVVAQLTAGDSFGEAALLLQAPSPISIKATSAWAKGVPKGRNLRNFRLEDGESPRNVWD